LTRRTKRAAFQALKVSAMATDGFRKRRGVVVLAYHRVGGGSDLEIDLPAAQFDAQMAVLAAEGRTIGLDAALKLLATPAPASDGPDPVVVTFDDGTADFADVALPILERHGIPATLYLATAFVEEQRSFPRDGTPLSWAALRDAIATGLVTVGSHTHTHRLLDRAAPDEVDQDLDRSIALIEDRLGVAAEHFAYPKAVRPNAQADAAVRHRFRSAALAGTRPNVYGKTDPYSLARSPIQVADGMRWFRRKLEGGMALEDDLRGVLNRRRYAGLRT
jgi:peptidoglycan/xylan/chitin deacetylase (PgdA/CDA1 family)